MEENTAEVISIKEKGEESSSAPFELAQRRLRWMAMFMDMFMLNVIVWAGSKLLQFHWSDVEYVGIALYLPISAYMHKELGATPGKLLLGLAVVDKDCKGIDWQASAIRSLVATISMALLSLGHLVALFNKKKMAAHDFAAKTYVIVKDKKSKAYISLLSLLVVAGLIVWGIVIYPELAAQKMKGG